MFFHKFIRNTDSILIYMEKRKIKRKLTPVHRENEFLTTLPRECGTFHVCLRLARPSSHKKRLSSSCFFKSLHLSLLMLISFNFEKYIAQNWLFFHLPRTGYEFKLANIYLSVIELQSRKLPDPPWVIIKVIPSRHFAHLDPSASLLWR